MSRSPLQKQFTIKGRGAGGNILSKIPIRRILLKEKGQSTLSARQIWWDDSVKRINTDGRGELLGSFAAGDKVFTMMQSGHYRIYPADPALQYLAGMTCMRLQLWGKAQQLLKQSVSRLSDATLQRNAWRALAELAEQRADATAAAQAWREAAKP